MSNIELNIDQLLLHGFSKRDAHYIRKAMQQELTRLLQEGGLPPAFSNEMTIPQLDISNFTVHPSARPITIGNQLAANVYASFTTLIQTTQLANNSPTNNK